MQYPKYPLLEKRDDESEFRFISEGPKGQIEIIVQFEQTKNDEIVNLAFGARNSDGKVDDKIILNNNDRNKILATIAEIIFNFSDSDDRIIFFKGSNKARTRLYRMAIAMNHSYLSKYFNVLGAFEENDEIIDFEPFENGRDYSGFFIKRK